MGTEEEKTTKDLILKEERLLDNTVRNDADKIAELMDDNCIEYTETGKRYNYRSGDLFGNLDGVLYIDSNSVRLIDLADNCKLLLYIAAKVNKNTRVKSNCSSIWKKSNDKWKIIFHQRTYSTEL